MICSANLCGATLCKHVRAHLCSNPIPRAVISDLGSEMSVELANMLAKYSIEFQSSSAGLKGGTSLAESSINIAKTSLRQLCLSDYINVPETLRNVSVHLKIQKFSNVFCEHLTYFI